MITDFHTHCFPDELAKKAMPKLEQTSGVRPCTDGTASGLLRRMDEDGIDFSVVCNIATNDKQTVNVNNFAVDTAKKYPRLKPLGSLFPLSDEEFVYAEAERLKKAGIPGIKIHPDYAGIDISDKSYEKIFDACVQNGLFLITHAGFDPVSPDHMHCTPDMILGIKKKFPDLTLVAAHCGSSGMIDEVSEKLCDTGICIDLSLCSVSNYSDSSVRRLFDRFDDRKMMFASDAPWGIPGDNLKYLSRFIGDGDRAERILHGNAERLLSGRF